MLSPRRVSSASWSCCLLLIVGLAFVASPCAVSPVLAVPCGDLRVGSTYNVLSTQAFVNCTSASSLWIQGGAPDLSGLANLTSVGGGATSLQVQSVTLSSLEGLHHIELVDSLYLYDSQVASLRGLRSLRVVAGLLRVNSNWALLNFSDAAALASGSVGAVEILSNSVLRDVSGIGNQTSLASLTIDSNNWLSSISGFDQLRTVTGVLEFYNNPRLTAIPPMDALQSVGFLNVQTNMRLVAFSAFNHLLTAQNVYITQNAALLTVPDFPSLQQVAVKVRIASNNLLVALPAMNALQSVAAIEIQYNPMLTDIGGFGSLVTAPIILVGNNNGLTTVSGFESLVHAPSLTFDTNAQLSSITGLRALQTAGLINLVSNGFVNLTAFDALTTADNIWISGNALISLGGFGSLQQVTNTLQLGGSALMILPDFPALTSAGTLSLSLPPSFTDGFRSLVTVGDLRISANNRLVTLGGFRALKQISGTLELGGNYALTSVSGFEALQTLGYLYMQYNYVLVNVSGFSSVTLATRLFIDSHNQLASFTAFPALQQLTIALVVTNNGWLSELTPFNQLTSAGAITISGSDIPQIAGFRNLTTATSLTLSSNAFLTSLSGFTSLQQFTGAMTVSSNPLLQSITGFTSMQSSDSVALTSNPLLSDISGLAGMTAAGDLTLTGLPLLATLTGLRSLQIVARTLKIQTIPLITSLAGLDSLQSALTITISNNAALADVGALSGLRFFTTVSISGPSVCCPSFEFFAVTRLPYSTIICQDCFAISPAAGSLTLPAGGGVTFGLGYNGSIWRNPIYVRAVTTAAVAKPATAMSPCTVLLTGLLCSAPAVLPSFAYAGVPLQLQISLNQLLWLPIGQTGGQSLEYVDFAVWANASAADAGVSTFETTAAPGVPDIKQRTKDANEMAVTLVAAIGAIAGFVLLLGLLLLCTSFGARFGGPLRRLDRFHWIDVRSDKSMTRDTTAEGGLFTAVSFVMMAGVLAAYLAQVALDNTAVSMALDPRPTDEVQASTFEATVTFGAPRQFVDTTPTFVPAYPGCRGWFEVSAVGFSKQGNASCSFDAAADAVTVHWLCADCVLELGVVSLSVVAPAANAFSRRMDWSFSSRDYFGDPSTVSGVTGADAGSYFKGQPLSQAALVALSTRYTDVSRPTRTGKLMTALNVARGSQVNAASFGSSSAVGSGVGFSFSVQSQSGWFNIILTAKATPLSIFAQVMAIVGGVLTLGRLAFSMEQKIVRKARGGPSGGPPHNDSGAASSDGACGASSLHPGDSSSDCITPNPVAGKFVEMSSIEESTQ